MAHSLQQDIIAEHALGQGLKQPVIDSLIAEQVPVRALARDWRGSYSWLLRDQVAFVGGRFEFARHLERRGVPVLSALTLVLFDENDEPEDILAFRPHLPPATWLGRASLIGAEQLLEPRFGDVLPIHRTPMEWLRAMRHGLVILDPGRAAPLLHLTGTLACESSDHANEVRRTLTIGPPRIIVDPNAGRAPPTLLAGGGYLTEPSEVAA